MIAPTPAKPATGKPTGLGTMLGMGGPPPKPAAAAPKPSSSPISQKSIDLVQASWAKVMPISDAAAALFYERLFELDPSVRPMFKEDITEQKKKLMQTLSVAVDGLSNIEKLVPVLQSLGARHAGYMVVDRHYDLVGEALLWTLHEGLGDDFTSDVEKAWGEVYGVVASVMKKAAAEVTKAAVDRQESPAAKTAASPAPKPAAAAPAPKAEPAPAPKATPKPQAGGPSARTISLVQSSWAKVMPISDAAATLFYERVFELAPQVRPMFKEDMREQKKKLMQTLSVAVDGLNNLDRLVPVLKDLGVRHTGYMVVDEHYDVVGDALLWTLREGIGDDFTPEVEQAWAEIYTLVAGVMKAAAADHLAAAGKAAPVTAPAALPAKGKQSLKGYVEETEEETLHYDSSRRPPIIAEDAIPLKAREQERRMSPGPAAGRAADRPSEAPTDRSAERPMAAPAAAPAPAKATPAPATAPAAAPAAAPSGVAVMLPLAGKDVTLNVRLTLDGPLTLRETPAAAPAPAPQPEGGSVAPALLLAALCSIAGMAVATMAPGLAGPVIARLGQGPLVPLTVAVLILVLVLTAFALGYLWGRGRQPSASGSTATKG